MNWYLKCWRQYADFKGRARRKEYWMFFLFNIIIVFLLDMIDASMGMLDEESGFGLLSGIYMLAVIVPNIAVSVRRLHDIGKSGWNYFIGMIPLVGPIVMIIWFATAGDVGSNDWGEDPKATEVEVL